MTESLQHHFSSRKIKENFLLILVQLCAVVSDVQDYLKPYAISEFFTQYFI